MTRPTSFDDASLCSPIPPIPHRDIPVVDETVSYAGAPIPVPQTIVVIEGRGRSRSRSRTPERDFYNPRYSPSPIGPRRRRSRSRSSTPSWERCRCRRRSPSPEYLRSSRVPPPRTPSPVSVLAAPIIPPLPQQPIVVMPPPMPASISSPSPLPWYQPAVWQTQIVKQPVDILTFHYSNSKNMAYVPAAKTYDVRPILTLVCGMCVRSDGIVGGNRYGSRALA